MILCFFADDGMLLARGIEETKRKVEILKEEAGKFGLVVNMEKSKCMMFNIEVRREDVQEIGGMEVVMKLNILELK